MAYLEYSLIWYLYLQIIGLVGAGVILVKFRAKKEEY